MSEKTYWKNRQELKYLAGEKKIKDYYKSLEQSFEQAKEEIQSTINDFYIKYSDENGVSYADAQKLLNRAEMKDLIEFIKKVNQYMGEYNLELNNMSIKARITRYQALEKQIDAILQQLYAIDYKYKGEEVLKDVYSDTYYRTWFNIDQYHGFHQEFAQISPYTIEELIKYPFNGANFSSRIWKQKDHMLQQLTESITTMIIQGKNPNTLSREFAKKFDTKEYEAYRLLHTEGSFIIEQGTLAAYREDDVNKYQILATLDHKTSEICRNEDNKIYDVAKAVVGVNYPPYHMFCRTTTVPYYEDSDYSRDTREARDPVTGKPYEVPADMKYKEWYDKYIKDNPEALLVEKKWKNRHSDRKQYERYEEILGIEYIPRSFDDFQNMKYKSREEYGILKAQTKGMTYYNKAIANEPEITEKVKQISEKVGMDPVGLEYRIKGKDSYLRKIRSNYSPNGNEYEVKDILRYTYTSSSEELAKKTMSSIDAYDEIGYNTIEIKNYWLDKYNPYNGINTVLSSPKGQKFELQYHTPESYRIKDGIHKMYEEWRALPEGSEEAKKLNRKMFDSYKGVAIPKDIERVK